MKKINLQNNNKFLNGYLVIQVLIFGAIGILILSGLLIFMDENIKSTNRDLMRVKALAVAEAGYEYYRFHLSKAPSDYYDGNGATSTGPYIHELKDKSGNLLGNFSLNIIPPTASGTTLVNIQSTGNVIQSPNILKTVQTKMSLPSLTKYSFITNSPLYFTDGTEVFGQVHSNRGVRFDGLAHNLVTSSISTFNDPTHSGSDEYGVHTHKGTDDPLPPNTLPTRSDIFTVGRQFPVPAVDFNGITQTLASLKSSAQNSGIYFPKLTDGSAGYEIILKTNGTFDLYKVLDQAGQPDTCKNYSYKKDWKSWSTGNRTFLRNYTNPTNGIVFIEDDVWVSGQINNTHLTIASAVFPVNISTYTNITVNNDLIYTNYDGRDVIGLIAQNNILVGMNSKDNLRIDGVLVAQNGGVNRYEYQNPTQDVNGNNNQDNCFNSYKKNTITTYGMIISNKPYGFSYSNGNGYTTKNLNYDKNLLSNTPPGFILTNEPYTTLSWEETR